MQVVVKAHAAGAQHYAARITAFLVEVFPLHANDVDLSDTICCLFSAMAAVPGCLPAIAQHGVPPLLRQLEASDRHLPVLTEKTLDLLCSFITDADLGTHL